MQVYDRREDHTCSGLSNITLTDVDRRSLRDNPNFLCESRNDFGSAHRFDRSPSQATHSQRCINAYAAVSFLNREPPDLDEVRDALSSIVGDAGRAPGIEPEGS